MIVLVNVLDKNVYLAAAAAVEPLQAGAIVEDLSPAAGWKYVL